MNLVARENQRIIKRDKKELEQQFEKRFEEIHETKYKMQKIIIENNAIEKAIDKWTAELDKKLEKME